MHTFSLEALPVTLPTPARSPQGEPVPHPPRALKRQQWKLFSSGFHVFQWRERLGRTSSSNMITWAILHKEYNNLEEHIEVQTC